MTFSLILSLDLSVPHTLFFVCLFGCFVTASRVSQILLSRFPPGAGQTVVSQLIFFGGVEAVSVCRSDPPTPPLWNWFY